MLAQSIVWRIVSLEEFSHHCSMRGGGSTGETTNVFLASLGESSRRGGSEACNC